MLKEGEMIFKDKGSSVLLHQPIVPLLSLITANHSAGIILDNHHFLGLTLVGDYVRNGHVSRYLVATVWIRKKIVRPRDEEDLKELSRTDAIVTINRSSVPT